MHPKAALLALQGFVPLHWTIATHTREYTFFAVHSRYLGSRDDVPTLTIDTDHQLYTVRLSVRGFVSGDWADVPDAVWDTFTDDMMDKLLEMSHAP